MDIQLTDYKVSQHCEQRYAERLLGKDNKNDINKFIVENKEKIKIDINKMISYGECIFVGKQSQKDGKGKVLNVYLKDIYVILVDIPSSVIVTLFKIDLGLGDDFNREYISKMMDKINESKKELEDVQLEVLKESNMYKELIDSTEAQINEYRAMIKNLEELCNGYASVIGNNNVKISQANRKVADCVNALINKKEF